MGNITALMKEPLKMYLLSFSPGTSTATFPMCGIIGSPTAAPRCVQHGLKWLCTGACSCCRSSACCCRAALGCCCLFEDSAPTMLASVTGSACIYGRYGLRTMKPKLARSSSSLQSRTGDLKHAIKRLHKITQFLYFPKFSHYVLRDASLVHRLAEEW